jgi:hypothetical protein
MMVLLSHKAWNAVNSLDEKCDQPSLPPFASEYIVDEKVQIKNLESCIETFN